MRISKEIVAVSRYFRQQRHGYMEQLGLKGLHARFLTDICQDPGISQDGLAQRIGIDKSNVARQVAFLEENEFLYREPSSSDKRVLCLYPTEKTLDMLPGLQAAMELWEQTLLQDLTEQEAEQLYALLARVSQRARKEYADGKIG